MGSNILATGSKSDFILSLLDETVPLGSVFLGWDSTPVAYTHNTKLFRISHPPVGAPKGYSEHFVDTGKPVCSSWPRGSWIYSTDIIGATEGGSSGSSVVNSSGNIVGQLSGACGYDVNDNCDRGLFSTAFFLYK